jgi:nitrous oxidase accessory protein NosD
MKTWIILYKRKGIGGTTAGIVITVDTGHVIKNNVIIGQGSQLVQLTVGIGVAYGIIGATIANNTVYDTPYGSRPLTLQAR